MNQWEAILAREGRKAAKGAAAKRNYVAITITLDPALKARTEAHAKKDDRSSSYIARQALERHLDYLDQLEAAATA
jgi:predicted DNA-binding protein